MTAKELSENTVNAMIKLGLTPSYAWSIYQKVYVPLIDEHQMTGNLEFNWDVFLEYHEELKQKLENGTLSHNQFCIYMRGIERMKEVYQTGELEWKGPKNKSQFVLNDYFQKLTTRFLDSQESSSKTRSDAMWICKKYFAWLIAEEHENLSMVSALEIQQFIIYCSKHMRSNSIRNVKLYMKKLYKFLYADGKSSCDYEGLFNFRVSRETKIYPAAVTEEVLKVLDIIDRCSIRGKRDYAIIIIGIVTGLRAVDIARLKLTDIDWINGEMKLIQSKTNQSLTLPLTEDVGTAIRDYILNGRQKTECDSLFLRMKPPFQGFINGNAIGDLYDDYRKKANFPKEAFDGKGFHSLRRRVGKNMATSGIPVQTIAQILGDSQLNSVKPYISLDSHHLKECALDFTGISITEVQS